MLYIIRKKRDIIFVLILVFFTGMLMKRSYMLNNSISTYNAIYKGYVVMIIDDFGNNSIGTDEMLSLDIPFTASVKPFQPYSVIDSQRAYSVGKDVILHMAMQSYSSKKIALESTNITAELSDYTIEDFFNEGIDEIHIAVGIINNMDMKELKDDAQMKELLTMARTKNLIFIDSITQPHSIYEETEIGASYFTADVIIDTNQDQGSIEKNIKQLSDIAFKRGYAIGIGHVGSEESRVTVAAIKKMVPELESRGINFVTISQLRDIIDESQ